MYRQLIGKRDDSQESPAKLVHSARIGERTTGMHISLLTYGRLRITCCSEISRKLIVRHRSTILRTRRARNPSWREGGRTKDCISAAPAALARYLAVRRLPDRSSRLLHCGMRKVGTSVFSRRSFALSVSLGGCLARSRRKKDR
jgi:hypothetical protein